MKKKGFLFVVVICFAMAFIAMSSLAFAAEKSSSKVDKSTYASLEKNLKTKHYDYNKGSLEVIDSETSNGVSALFVEYETIRDHLFKKHHKEVLYYDNKEKTLLTSVTDEKALSFADTYKDDVHVKVSHTAFLLVTAIVYLIAYFVMYTSASRTKG